MADYNARQVVAAVANVPPSGGLPERKPRTHRNHRLAMNDDGGRKRERFPLPKASGRFSSVKGPSPERPATTRLRRNRPLTLPRSNSRDTPKTDVDQQIQSGSRLGSDPGEAAPPAMASSPRASRRPE